MIDSLIANIELISDMKKSYSERPEKLKPKCRHKRLMTDDLENTAAPSTVINVEII